MKPQQSKLSPEVEPFVPKQRKEQQAVGTPWPPDAFSTGADEHNACTTFRGPGYSQERPSPQKDDSCDVQKSGGSKHGYSSSRRARRVPQRQDSAMERTLSESPRKMLRPSSDLICLERKTSTEPVQKKEGSVKEAERRGTRSTPHYAKNCKTQRNEADPFEVDLSDFPELSVPTAAKPCLRAPSPSPVASPPASASPSKASSCALLLHASRKGPSTDCGPNLQTPDSREAKTKPPQDRPLEPTTAGPASSSPSWATVACQPPRRLQPKAPPLQEEDKAEMNLEQATGMKKKSNKKKKRKSNQTDDNPEAKPAVPEPPKFEDEEEFPDLARAVSRVDRGQGPTRSATPPSGPPRTPKEDRDGDLQRGGDRSASVKPQAAGPPADAKKGPVGTKPSGKKSKVPVQLDLGNMLAVLEQKQVSQKSKQDHKPVVFSVGGGLPILQKDVSAPKKHPRQVEKVAHNPLDSTSPLVKKGKQREVPKAKKLTPLKRVILKEREERKQNRLLEERGLLPVTADCGPCGTEVVVQLESLQLDENQHSPTDFTEEHMDVEVDLYTEGNPEQLEISSQPSKDDTPAETKLEQQPKIHSRKFRDYCNQVLSQEVDDCVTGLLKELVRFQDRLYQKDPMKARMKRRLVMGLREVLKHLKLRKVKCVIISPNCERIQSKGGLDEALHTIIDTCREQGVPFVFALSRKALGRCVNKAVPVSLVGIFNYDGAQDLYHRMIELSAEARKAYEAMIGSLEQPPREAPQVPVEQQRVDSSPDPAAVEDPEYIKVWKKMLEKESNHQFLYLEELLPPAGVAGDPGLQPEPDEGS
ncbi:selenocysteine insertion sequence-binding protein 2 isoform X3 [Arapaima gigas]